MGLTMTIKGYRNSFKVRTVAREYRVAGGVGAREHGLRPVELDRPLLVYVPLPEYDYEGALTYNP